MSRAAREESADVASTQRGAAASALANRDFRWFFVGNAVSQTGTYLQNGVQAVLIYELTGRNVGVGLTNAFTFMPVLLLALVGGELADRFDRRRIFVATQLVSVAAVGALAAAAAAEAVTPVWIYATALLLGVAYAIAIPTMHALIPSLVTPRQLGPAVGLTAVTFNVARVVGPGLAAAALAAFGYAIAFGLNALTFAFFVAALLMIRVRPRAVDERRATIRQGFRAAWDDRAVRGMLLAIAALAVSLDPVNTLTPAFAVEVFGQDKAAAPLFISAFGAGSIVAAFGIGRMFRRAEADLRLGALTLSLMGAGMAAFALSPAFWVGYLALFAAGVGSLSTVTLFTTGIQQRVDDAVRGKVMAIWTLCALGMRFPAGIVGGALGDAVGPRGAALLMQVPLVLVVALVLWRLPAVRGRAEPASLEFAE